MNADRLREAACWLQSEADWVRTLGLSWQREAAMAALLRAVADDWPCRCDRSFSMCRVHNVASLGHKTVKAADALADAILGAES